MGKRKTHIILFISLILVILLLIIINILTGSVGISARDIPGILLKGDKSSVDGRIILDIRLPRIIEAVFLGGALALSGYMLQTFFLNPIAGPYILGISSGAKLMVALLMVLSLARGFAVNSFAMVAAAFLGAMISMGLILIISGKVKRMSVLIVCGVMIGYICSAVTDFIVNFSDDANIVHLHNWSM